MFSNSQFKTFLMFGSPIFDFTFLFSNVSHCIQNLFYIRSNIDFFRKNHWKLQFFMTKKIDWPLTNDERKQNEYIQKHESSYRPADDVIRS